MADKLIPKGESKLDIFAVLRDNQLCRGSVGVRVMELENQDESYFFLFCPQGPFVLLFIFEKESMRGTRINIK